MINARLALLLLSPLLLLGATCVTKVEQKGPTGPWIGEVLNTGPETIGDMLVTAFILDANGVAVSGPYATTCPWTLLPGERAAFEFSALPNYPYLELPLRAEILPVRADIPWPDIPVGDLLVRLVDRDAERHYVLVEMRNDSPFTYREVAVCAILRAPDGKVAAVGSAYVFPSVIRPREARMFPIFFSSVLNGTVELFSRAMTSITSTEVLLDPSLFSVSAMRVAYGAGGRELQIVGEVRNTSGDDLAGLRLQAYPAGNTAARVEAEVGCGGSVAQGATAPVAFILPLGSGAEPIVQIVGIQGSRDVDLYPIPVRGVSRRSVPDTRSVLVEATLTNPTRSWLQIVGVCLNVRSADGALVGTLSVVPEDDLGPGAIVAVSGEVNLLAKAASADVTAYGWPIEGPPTEIPIAVAEP